MTEVIEESELIILKAKVASTADRTHALHQLYTFSRDERNHLLLISPEIGLVPVLIKILKEDKRVRIQLLDIFWNLSAGQQFDGEMNGLIEALVECVKEDEIFSNQSYFGALKNLTIKKGNKVKMASSELGLLTVIVKALRENVCTTDVRSQVLGILNSMASLSGLDTADQLRLSNEFIGSGILSVILSHWPTLDKSKDKDSVSGMLWNCVENSPNVFAPEYLSLHIHTFILEKIKCLGPDACLWQETVRRTISNFFSVIMNLCRNEAAAKVCKSVGAVDIMCSIASIKENGGERLKAIVTLALLIGREEPRPTEAYQLPELYQFQSGSFMQLMEVFDDVLSERGGADYPLGTFCVQLLVNVAQVLSLSDCNKAVMVSGPRLLSYLVRILQMFVSGSAPIHLCGGGGNDAITAELCIETLVHLSFHYADDHTLCTDYMTPSTGVREVLAPCTENTRLRKEAQFNAHLLLQRLSNPDITSLSTTAINSRAGQDRMCASLREGRTLVMVSFSSDESSNPGMVSLLCTTLLGRGIEVSSRADIVTHPHDASSSSSSSSSITSAEASMEAMEGATWAILCLSAKYKETPRCRMEATHAHKLHKMGKLKLSFVVMQECDSNASELGYATGWLAPLVGEALCYPGWNERCLGSTVDTLVQLIEAGDSDQGEVSSSPALIRQSDAGPVSMLPAVPPPDPAASPPPPPSPTSSALQSTAAGVEIRQPSSSEEGLDAVLSRSQYPFAVEREIAAVLSCSQEPTSSHSGLAAALSRIEHLENLLAQKERALAEKDKLLVERDRSHAVVLAERDRALSEKDKLLNETIRLLVELKKA